LAIAFWIVGSCWAVAAVAYLFDAAGGLVLPLLAFGAVAGFVEWLVRRKQS
jgi:H+/Cl- antiporter ClcA